MKAVATELQWKPVRATSACPCSPVAGKRPSGLPRRRPRPCAAHRVALSFFFLSTCFRLSDATLAPPQLQGGLLSQWLPGRSEACYWQRVRRCTGYKPRRLKLCLQCLPLSPACTDIRNCWQAASNDMVHTRTVPPQTTTRNVQTQGTVTVAARAARVSAGSQARHEKRQGLQRLGDPHSCCIQ